MAYLDTLFQLGMDLTRSSTAQKEDHVATARVERAADLVHRTREDRIEDITTRTGARRPAGRHLLIDLDDATRLDDVDHVERTLKRCVEVADATLLHVHLYRTSPKGGVSGAAVLSESHIGVHTWPESGYAAFDVFMSGNADLRRTVDILREAFSAGSVTVREHARGRSEPNELRWQAAKKSTPRVRKAKAA